MSKYFAIPFAMNGDRKEIPTDKQEDGSISFDEGYGADYEKNKQVDPTAKDISRQEFNSVLHDITGAIGEIQRSGVATWTNEISYNKGATIIHNGAVYTSTINANKNEPPHSSWSSLDLSEYRKKDDLLFNGMVQVQATDDVGTGVFLLDKDGTPRGQMTYNSGGLQFAQYDGEGESHTYTLPREGGALLTDRGGEISLPDLGGTLAVNPTDSIFGAGGMKLLVGEEYNSHQGFGGLVVLPDKMLYIYRVGASHAIANNSKVVCITSLDNGVSWSKPVVLYSTPDSDARPDPPRLMDGNRIGFFINRQSEDKTHYSPLFMYSDDSGDSFKYIEVELNSPYTFQAVGGILGYPASQGGDDKKGFVSFGFAVGGVMDALTTVDNGSTWTSVKGVAQLGLDITALSENMGIRVGVQDKWIFACRARDSKGWRKELTIYTTSTLLNWGTPKPSGILLGGGNPPCLIYDKDTNKAHLLTVTRGRERSVNSYESNLLEASVDADLLYNNGGNFNTSKAYYRHLAYLPYWATGYMYPIKLGGKFITQITCGEPSDSGGNYGYTILCGDFLVGGMEQSRLNYLSAQHTRNIKTLQFRDEGNTRDTLLSIDSITGFGNSGKSYNVNSGHVSWDFTPYINSGLPIGYTPTNKSRIHLGVLGGDWSALSSYAPTGVRRTHIEFITTDGVAGNITTTGNATSYNTTSDERMKKFLGEFDPLEAKDIILKDPVRHFVWSTNGEADVGWSAQKSYSICDRLANPPVHENTVWTMDKTRRIELLWSAVAYLLDKIDNS